MGTGYVRQSSANIITGNIIEASDLNAEFNAIENSFNASTGHSHDGTTGEGPKIDLTTSVTGVLPIANGGTGFSALGSISSKTTPVDADSAVIVDSADSNNPKRLTFSNLWTWAQSKAASPGFTSIVTSGNTTVGGTLGVTGATTLSSTLGVTGNTTIGGTLGITGATTLNSTLAVTGNTTIGGTLGVTGATTLSSTLAVTGNTTVGGTLGVTGATTLAGLSATTIAGSGNATIGGTLGVTGAVTLSNTLGVTGNTTLAALSATSATIGGTLGVTGATTLSSTLAVTGNTTVGGTLGVTGITTLAAVSASSLTLTTPLAVAQGGTESTTAAAARTALFGVSTTTDNAVARYDSTSGALQNSGVLIDDSNNLTVPGDITFNGGSSLVNDTLFKADNLSGLASASVARSNLGLGSDGSLSHRNKIINGGMQIAQRGTSFSGGTANADDTYTLDRWYILSEGSDSVDVTQSTEHPDANGKSIALDVETTGEKFGIAQIIEGVNCVGMIGNDVTLSFKAKVSNGRIDTVKCGIVAWSGTIDTVTSDIVSSWGADGTTPTLIANATFENTPADLGVTTDWATYSVTANVDTANAKNIIVFIWSDDATNPTAGDFLYISDVQLEAGDAATPFEHRGFGPELTLCQRYYEKSYSVDTVPGTVTSVGGFRNVTVALISGFPAHHIYFSVEKRAPPTVTVYNPSTGASGSVRTDIATDVAVVAAFIGTRGCDVNVSASISSGLPYGGQWTANAEL